MEYERLMSTIKEELPKINQSISKILEIGRNITMPYANTVINNEIIRHMEEFSQTGGKRIRPFLTIVGYRGIAGEPHEGVYLVASGLEVLHAAFLAIDDVMDMDAIRRGEPSLWKRYHQNIAYIGDWEAYNLGIIGGNILVAYSNIAILEAPLDPSTKIRALNYLNKIISLTNHGQVLDITLSTMPIEMVREEDVLKVHELKTAKYTFEAPLHMGATLAGADDVVYRWYSDYAVPVGIAFQLRDDILGLFGDEDKIGKPVGSDVREGKRTLLVVKAYEWGSDEQKKRLKELLGKKDLSLDELEEFREIVRETGSLDYSLKRMNELVELGKAAIDGADIDGEVKEVLKELADYIVKREK